MKTFVTELAFLFVWISLCCGRVLLSGGNRPSFCLLTKGMYDVLLYICTFSSVPMNSVAYSPCTKNIRCLWYMK